MLKGSKNNRHLFKYLIERSLPNQIDFYVEPFGGEFGLWKMLENKPKLSIYNDIDKELYEQVSNELSGHNIKFFNTDYKTIIDMFDGDDTFFYCDPPYYQKFYYNYNLTEEQHIELSNILKNIKGRFLLSYQKRPFITELYKDFTIDRYSGINRIYKPEITIRNY